MTVNRTKAEIERAECFASYRIGWRDGAMSRAKATTYAGHRLETAYECGYVAGALAYREAMRVASARFEYTPSVLREEAEV